MKQVKKHIGWLFLWIFLVPQCSNVLHFWIIKHDFSRELSLKPLVSDKKLVHYCDQTLFKTPVMLLYDCDFTVPYLIIFAKQELGARLQGFVKKVFFNGYYLRGPPVKLY